MNYGKDRMIELLNSFGAIVTGSVSGKTDILLKGIEPGMKKVSEARARNIPIVDTVELKIGLDDANQNLIPNTINQNL